MLRISLLRKKRPDKPGRLNLFADGIVILYAFIRHSLSVILHSESPQSPFPLHQSEKNQTHFPTFSEVLHFLLI